LLSAGVPAVGLSGEDGALLVAHPLDGGALGAVGSPSDVTPGVLLALLDHGFVPVVSPLGRHVSSGDGLNVNGDDAAAAIAVALHADDLLLVADVDGVRDAEGQRVDVLDLDAAARLVRAGVAHGGMSAKLDAARRAVMGGVRCVRIGALDAIRDLSSGTLLTLTPSVV
jgi:acetylglutamate kinase